MSFKSMAWAAAQQPPSCHDKLVLLQLASHVNANTGLCNPSIDTLARECILSRRRVIMSIQSLEEAGFIEVMRSSTDRKKNVNTYKLSTVVHRVHHSVVHNGHYPSAQHALPVVHNVHINREDEHTLSKRIDDRGQTERTPSAAEAIAKLAAWRASITGKPQPASEQSSG